MWVIVTLNEGDVHKHSLPISDQKLFNEDHITGFESEVADYVGINGALAVNSGTAALHLALRLLEVRGGDVVYCSTLTSVASANPIIYQGAKPVFIDSDPDNWNMSPVALEKALREAFLNHNLPKAVIIVNLYGQTANFKPLIDLCDYYQVPIIEDASHSFGSTYNSKKSGTFGYFGIYSFGPNKIVTTSGGGVLVSNDWRYIEFANHLATQARDYVDFNHHTMIGYNYRLSNVLAEIGRNQLITLDNSIQRKRAIFNRYQQELSNIGGITFIKPLVNSIIN